MPGFKMRIGSSGRTLHPTARGSATLALFREEDDRMRPSTKSPGVLRAGFEARAAEGVDSLDAFMAGIAAEVAKPQGDDATFAKKAKAAWEELQAEDPVVSYCEAFDRGERGIINPKARKESAVQAEVAEEREPEEPAVSDDDDDENGDRRLKPIEPLPHIDHSRIEYRAVQKHFYTPHPEIASLSSDKAAELQKELRVSVTGSDVPSLVVSFAHLGLPEELMEGIRKHGYVTPTPIQAQAIPAALSGRDVVGIAETGSGKTVAYLMPLLVHCAAQPRLHKGEGPIGLVLCPTRELAIQIEKETFRFNKLMGLRSTTLAGGLSKYQQFKAVKSGSEIVIATPGRMIDIVKMKGCDMQRCTFVVLDEADRMLQMGFEHQMRSIMQNVRPTRQTLLFSATFPPKIERACMDLLQQPVRITVGKLGQAAENITQIVEVLAAEQDKWAWLANRVGGVLAQGQLLVFRKSKQGAEELANRFVEQLQRSAAVLHGDLDQDERNRILDSIRKRQVDILIATDLAARGLDIPSIRTVVSYDAARDIETHTHRVGRTGRAGAEGDAFTLLVADAQGRKMAALLLDHLEQVGAPVTGDLLALAMQHPPFRAARLAGQRPLRQKRRRRGAAEPQGPIAGATSPATESAVVPIEALATVAAASRSRSRSPTAPPPTP
mmetsp:Transcript_8965/g.24921  ORF Transcript_8965/g.24921 Transcript_8965/m.24921 type:complete len:665 (-) Transcript_8965:280-2274(-)